MKYPRKPPHLYIGVCGGGKSASTIKRYWINNQIRAREVRLIDETGKNLGIVSLPQALQVARERNLDLIQITEKLLPPVCKIGNFGKFKYWQEKKEREARGKQKGGETKGLRLSLAISEHDMEIRVNQAEKFLKNGNKVRIEMILKGREKAMQNFAREKFNKLLEMIKAKVEIKIEGDLKRAPRGLVMIISKT